jgi:hypothetical protein
VSMDGCVAGGGTGNGHILNLGRIEEGRGSVISMSE